MTGIELFYGNYVAELEKAAKDNPTEYPWYGRVPTVAVAQRMRDAFVEGSYNKDGAAIHNTCKKLGIKHTYKAIAEFFIKDVEAIHEMAF